MTKKENPKQKVQKQELTSATRSSAVVSTAKPKTHHRLIKKIADEDWDSIKQLMKWHNENFTDKKMTFGRFFKLMNTYSPIVQSLMQLDPNDSPIQRLGVNTVMCHAKMWVRNIGNNVARIKEEHDIREFKGKFSDKAAIIIGAGESLKDNASGTDHLQLIKEYADKFDGIIIVTDRVLKDCLELGIGDYFTVVDGSDIIYDRFFDNEMIRNFNGMYHKSNIKAIMATCTSKKVVNSWKGQIYFFVASIPAEILPNATPLMCDFTGTSDINAGGNCGMLDGI